MLWIIISNNNNTYRTHSTRNNTNKSEVFSLVRRRTYVIAVLNLQSSALGASALKWTCDVCIVFTYKRCADVNLYWAICHRTRHTDTMPTKIRNIVQDVIKTSAHQALPIVWMSWTSCTEEIATHSQCELWMQCTEASTISMSTLPCTILLCGEKEIFIFSLANWLLVCSDYVWPWEVLNCNLITYNVF